MKRGVTIEEVLEGSPAHRAGLRDGDVLLEVNGHRVEDLLDYLYWAEPPLRLLLRRGRRVFKAELPGEGEPGLRLRHFKVRRCRNHCIFCFVHQLPRGLRPHLYVKDEDYRMSFLYGNYITMTDLSEKDKERIVRLGLSPLYISVHSTERALRNRLLGNPRAPDIMGELQWLREHRLRAHTQIVLCPGYNDRQHLERTLEDLYRFYPYVASIAVVPVGLTAHRRGTVPLRPLSVQDARDALRRIQAFQRRWLRRHGEPIVYAADELYIKAGRPLPPLRHYGELPQVENGVGMVALFQHQAQRLRITRAKTRCRFLLFTGASFYPFLKGFVERLKGAGYRVSLVGVQNRFFGPTVTVAGLLTGRDILRSLAEHARGHDILLVPQNALREAGEPCFLDDVHIRELQEALGLKALAVEPSPEAVLEAMKAC